MNLTASRKKAEEVAADHTVRLFMFISTVLVVEMLSALLQCYP